MLFTDGIILSSQDLREHDNFVLEVASTESIELSSKLAIAQRAVGYELASFLANREAPVALDRVVVNDELRDLLAIQTLAAVYSDAYNRHLNDRYLGRAKDLRNAGERSFRRYLENGVGITGIAVPRAAIPGVNMRPEGELVAGVYVVQLAWEHVAGTVGERSDLLSVDCSGGGFVVVPGKRPSSAAGWHVFIAQGDGTPTRQNEATIGAEVPWVQASSLRFDLPLTEPSGADYYIRQAAQMVRR